MMRWNFSNVDSIKKTLKIATTAPFLLLICLYRYFISPCLPVSCRYHPSCSEYSYQAIQTHGLFFGAWLSIKRLLSCHPWSAGGFDPVPGKTCSHQHKHTNKAHKNG